MSKYNKAFGDYEPGTTGHILNSLEAAGIPMHIADSVGIGSWLVTYHGKIFAYFRSFEGIEDTLFRFTDPHYNKQRTKEFQGDLVPDFRLQLNSNSYPALIVSGQLVTRELVKFVQEMVFHTKPKGYDMLYAINMACSPEILVKPNPEEYEPDNKALQLEIKFGLSHGAQAFVDYVNTHFKYAR
jgi:hypothetical protein